MIQSNTTCSICKKQFNKYICPKCNVHYCSLLCYKVHSKDCTNIFYKERIVENLKTPNAPETFKVETLEMLKNIDKEKHENSLDEEDLEVLSKLNLEQDISLKDLPENLQKDFQKSLKDGRISTWMKIWVPWWTQSPKIIEVKDEKKLTNILKLTGGKEPNIALKYSLIDLIYSYCYCERILNGESLSSLDESKNYILILSSTLAENRIYQFSEQSISKCLENARNHEVFDSIQFSISILDDVISILSSRDFTLRTLNYLEEIFKKDVKLQKKLYFYQSWIDSYFEKLTFDEIKQYKEVQEEILKK